MDRQSMFAQIADYLATAFEVPRDLITPEADLVEKLNLDSIDAIDLMVRVQEITGRKVAPEEFKNVRTIDDVLNLAQGCMPKVDVSAIFFAGVSILYPLIAAVAVHTVGPLWVVGGLFLILILRGALGLRQKIPGGLTYGLLAVALSVAAVAIYNRELSVRLYPAFMSAAMLLAFGMTLVRGPSMIERFARLIEPNLPESGVRYTRTVTAIWVVFFALNGAVAVWTALYAPWHTWTLYNGLIAYIAMGVIAGGELLVRPFFQRTADHAP